MSGTPVLVLLQSTLIGVIGLFHEWVSSIFLVFFLIKIYESYFWLHVDKKNSKLASHKRFPYK